MKRGIWLIAVVIVTLTATGAAQRQGVTVSHTLTVREQAALDAWLLRSEQEEAALAADPQLAPTTVTQGMRNDWLSRVVATALAPQMEQLDKSELAEAAADIRALSQEECDALNGARKKAGKAALKRCGKGGQQ